MLKKLAIIFVAVILCLLAVPTMMHGGCKVFPVMDSSDTAGLGFKGWCAVAAGGGVPTQ